MTPKPWILQNHLLHAIQNNDIGTVESLFDQGVDIDSILYTGHLGKPAICICVEKGYYKMAKILVGRGCSLSLTTASGFTPLHLAVMCADNNFADLFLKNRANVRALDATGQTALHIACSRSSQANVQLLIDQGSDCNKFDDEGRTPLFLACAQGNCSIVSCLLKNGAKVNFTDACGNSPLVYAVVHQNSLELTKMLISAGADVNLVNSYDETPLLCMIKNYDFRRRDIPDDLSVIDLLINSGCRLDIVTSVGQTLLHISVCQRRVHLTRKLINKGCDVNESDCLGFPPLFYACRDGSESITLMLLAAGADFRHQAWLHSESLIKICKKEIAQWLLDKCSQCRTLSEMCVLKCREVLNTNVELAMQEIDFPTTLKNLITLNTYC